jgi:Na+-transporting NADH:ubiquinone oxidoreductase subunit NqrD
VSDEPEQQPWEWRVGIGLTALVFNGIVVWWCLVYGNSENLLHQNAMSWSYILSAVVLGGLGFGAVLPSVLPYIKGKA